MINFFYQQECNAQTYVRMGLLFIQDVGGYFVVRGAAAIVKTGKYGARVDGIELLRDFGQHKTFSDAARASRGVGGRYQTTITDRVCTVREAEDVMAKAMRDTSSPIYDSTYTKAKAPDGNKYLYKNGTTAPRPKIKIYAP